MIKLKDFLTEVLITQTKNDFANNVDVSELKSELRVDSNTFWAMFTKVVDDLNKLPNPIRVYRGIQADEVDYKNLGKNWTYEKEKAKPYVTGPNPKAGLIILQGNIDKQYVDQTETIARNLLSPEKEIFINDPSKVVLVTPKK
jgi:hypothetical protein